MRVNCLAENHYDLPVGGFAGGETDRWKRGAVALLEPRRHPATITVAQSTAMLVPATDATVTCSQGLDTGASPGVTELQYELTAGSLNDRVPATATPTIFGWLANWIRRPSQQLLTRWRARRATQVASPAQALASRSPSRTDVDCSFWSFKDPCRRSPQREGASPHLPRRFLVSSFKTKTRPQDP